MLLLVWSCTAGRGGLEGSCTDGILNQDETDVDCGGNTCARCPTGSACVFGLDCQSGVCDPASNACEPAGACGNGTVDEAEGCDDGALIDGDGCNADCFLELGEPCTLNSQCASAACDTEFTGECVLGGVCGNGIVEPGEGCDDGDTDPRDGCDADCLRELAQECDQDNQCASSVCDSTETPDVCEASNVCGNGRREAGEACDDGGNTGGDGCSANCRLENGQECGTDEDCLSTVCDQTETPDVCEPANVCGNGKPEGDEGCDDGNRLNDDGCDQDCLVEDGSPCGDDDDCQSEICDATESPDTCEPADTCGNSRLETFEACDDGNLESGDGCGVNCLRETGEFCTSGFQCESSVCLGSMCQ